MLSAKGLDWAALSDPERWPEGARRTDIAEAAAALRAALAPANGEEVATWVEFLLSRYRARGDAPAFADMDKRLWVAAVGHWPLDVLEAAVTAWCLEDRPFPPSVPGELKPLGEPIHVARLSLLYRAEKMLAAPARDRGEGVGPEAMQRLIESVRLKPTRPKAPGALAKFFARRREDASAIEVTADE